MSRSIRALLALSLSLTVAGASACGDDTGGAGGGASAGEGRVTLTTWGEEYIEVGIPSSEFADGWSATFDRFLVLVGEVRIAEAEGAEPAARVEGLTLVDHVSPGVKPVASLTLEAGNYTHVSFQTSPAASAAEITLGQGATAADAEAMVAGGCHVWVQGSITDGTTTKTFDWCFGVPTLLDACEGELDGKLTEGVVVTEGGEDQVELTIHGDHFFYDDLQADQAVLRAQVFADADADDDGAVTLEELAAVDLDDLPADSYGTGSATGVENLRDYVAFLTRTLGHFRGEGECFVRDP